jgi:predicted transposase YbfD/YdcC
LLADSLQSRQQAPNGNIQQAVVLRGGGHLLLEGLLAVPLQDGAEDLQQTPDLVPQVRLYADQLRPDTCDLSRRRLELRFPGLAAIGMVESETERNGTIKREKRYYFCSTRLDVDSFARIVRGHWGIENRLHWVLDVVFRDDLARLRSGHGPANMAVIKHTALNLLTQAKPTISLKNRRKKAAWNQDYLAGVIAGTA